MKYEFNLDFLKNKIIPIQGLNAAIKVYPKINVYDATMFLNKPDLSLYGIKPIRFVYTAEIFSKGWDLQKPDLAQIAKVAPSWPTDGTPVAIDIEQWKVDSLNITDTVNKFSQVADAVKAANPNVRFGFYSYPPVRNYQCAQPYYMPGGAGYIGQAKTGTPWYDAWVKQNLAFMPLASKVDFIFPSLYTFYKDQAGWLNYAKENIAQCARYGKPVIPVLWMLYHNSNKEGVALTEIPSDFWKLQIDTCASLASGVAIWGGNATSWDESALWWGATLSSM